MWKWIIKKPSRIITFWIVMIVIAISLFVAAAVKFSEVSCAARWEAPTRWTWLARCQVKTKMGWVQEERVRGF